MVLCAFAATFVAVWAAPQYVVGSPHHVVFDHRAEDGYVVQRIAAIATDLSANVNTMTPAQILIARTKMLYLVNLLPLGSSPEQQMTLGSLRSAEVVIQARIERENNVAQSAGIKTASAADLHAAMWPTRAETENRMIGSDPMSSWLSWFVYLYKLAIPFAIIAFWIRLRQLGRRMHDYALEHTGDLVVCAALWPIAFLGEFPLWTPVTSLRDEIRERLALLPQGDSMLRYAGSCAAILCSVVLASIVPVRTAHADEAAKQPGVEVHGFVDARAASDGGVQLSHGWLQAVGPVAPGANVDVAVDPISSKVPVRQVAATFGPEDGSFGARVGRIPTAVALTVPAPQSEQIEGGPVAAGNLATFFATGAEVFARVGCVTVRVSELADGGRGMALNDTMLGVSWQPFGQGNRSVVEVVGDASRQAATDMRTRWLLHARLGEVWRAYFDFTGVVQRLNGETTLGLSNYVVVPIMAHGEFSAGYDWARQPSGTGEHLLRMQGTLISFSSSLRSAIMARWSSATGWLGDVRIQFVF